MTDTTISWSATPAKYTAVHVWMSRTFGKPSICEGTTCRKISKKYHWANLSGKYLYNRDDWKRLCVSCHRLLDYGGKCKRGHKFDEKNTYTAPKTGTRGCRTCRLASAYKWKEKHGLV